MKTITLKLTHDQARALSMHILEIGYANEEGDDYRPEDLCEAIKEWVTAFHSAFDRIE